MADDARESAPAPEGSPTPTHLARYVAPDLLSRLGAAENGGDLTRAEQFEVLGPLTDLLHLVAMYVPSIAVVEAMTPRPDPRGGRFTEGTVLYADISGFTPLTAALCRAGGAGAEELTRLINGFFDPMVEIVQNHGGCLLRFGGDSLLAIFPAVEPSGNTRPCADAQAAVACSMAMVRAMSDLSHLETSVGPARLEMSVGLAAGAVFVATVGIPGERLEFLATGGPVYDSARAEAGAASGEVVLTRAVAARLSPAARLTPLADDLLRWDDALPTVAPASPAPDPAAGLATLPFAQRVRESVQRIESLRPFLPAALFARLEADPGRVELPGELRTVTSVFIHLDGLGPLLADAAPERVPGLTALLNDTVGGIHRIVAAHGGFFARLDAFTRGDKLLLLFGTPVAHERDEESALLCCRALIRELAVINAQHRTALTLHCGVNTGLAFCGNAGSLLRKEYTVMGDEVNLAARMMGKAGADDVLVGPATRARAGTRVRFGTERPTQFKGRAEPLAVSSLAGAAEEEPESPADTGSPDAATRGRDEPLAILEDALDTTRRARGQLVVLLGEAGIGKSHLLHDLIRRARAQGFTCWMGRAQAQGARTAWQPWLPILKQLFGLTADESPTERGEKIRRSIELREPSLLPLAPLIAEVLQVPLVEGPELRELHADLRRDRLLDALARLFEREARSRPLLLALEDGAWMDDLSLQLAGRLVAALADAPALLAVAARPERDLTLLLRQPGARVIRLGPLTPAACLAIVRDQRGGQEVPADWSASLLERAHGNPLFVRELALALGRSGMVPMSLSALLLARVDALPEPERLALRASALLGMRFKTSTLQALVPVGSARQDLAGRLSSLTTRGLLECETNGADPVYAWCQSLVQQAVYETLPRSERRDGHRRVLDHMEQREGDKLARYAELLCWHAEHGEDEPRLRRYLVMAGEKAMSAGAPGPAADLFARAIARWETAPAADAAPALIPLYQRMAEACRIAGRMVESEDALERGLAVAQRQTDRAAARAILLDWAEIRFLRGDLPGARALALDAARAPAADDPLHPRAALMLARVLRAMGEHEEARRCARDAYERLTHAGGVSQPRVLAQACGALAALDLDHGAPELAVRWLERALSAVVEAADAAEHVRVLQSLGRAELRRGHHEAALGRFTEALQRATALGFHEGVAAALTDLGRLAFRTGATVRAIGFFRNALETLQRLGADRGAADASANLAEALTVSGEIEEAQRCAARALHAAKRIGDLRLRARAEARTGAVLAVRGRYPEAGEHLEEAVALARRSGDRYLLSAALRQQSELCRETADYEAARAHTEEALDIASQSGDSEGVAQALCDRARLQLAQAQADDGEASLSEALVALEGVDAPLARARILDGLGRLAFFRSRYDEAEARCRDALALRQQANDQAGQAESLLALAEVNAARGDYPTALSQARDSADRCRQMSWQRGVLLAETRLGSVHALRGQYEESAARLEQALGIARAMGEEAAVAEVLNLRGRLLRRCGRFDDALADHAEVLEHARRLGLRLLEVSALDDLGAARAARQDYAIALELHEQALALAEQIGDRREAVRVRMNLTRVHLVLANHEDAAGLLDQARADAEAIGDRAGAVRARIYRADLALVTGHPAEALAELTSARAAAEALADGDAVLAASVRLARARLAAGDPRTARQELERARRDAEEMGSPVRRIEALRGLGVCLRHLGCAGPASALLDSALDGAQELGERSIEVETLADCAELSLDLGDGAAAAAALDRAAALSHTVRAVGLQHRVHALAGWLDLLEAQQQPGPALRKLEHAHQLAALVGARESVLLARAGLALANALLGHLESALELADEALSRARGRGYLHLVPRLAWVASVVQHRAGNDADAAATAQSAIEFAETHGFRGLLWRLRDAGAAALAALGQATEAATARRHAWAEAQEVADTLDGETRRRFLASPPVAALERDAGDRMP